MTVKDYEFPVSVRSLGGPRTIVTSASKPPLKVAVPPEFGGPDANAWSPEALLVAAVASCYTVTLAAVLDRRDLRVQALEVRGTGHVEEGPEGLGFILVELRVEIEADEGLWPKIEAAALQTEQPCIASRALDTPVHVTVVRHRAEPSPAALSTPNP